MIALRTIPRICVALGAAHTRELEAMALEACDSGEEFFELRLDLVKDSSKGLRVIGRILRRYPDAIVLATCRRKPNHGGFEGSIEEQFRILNGAVRAGAKLVDVEIETAQEAPEETVALREKARVVLSYHDFERTPPLARILKTMRRIPADIYKITTTAVKPSDNLRLLDLAAIDDAPSLVLLAMGETGAASRILSPSRGAVFTFASPEPGRGEATAPGQFSASCMRNCFQAHRRKPSTKIFGVIADPVAHSMSPALHNRAFRTRRIDAVYLPFRVAPALLNDFIKSAEALPVSGFSVTIPHKQRVMRHLDLIDPLAKRIGAVNTVYRKQGKLRGTNTDAVGVVRPLEKKVRLNHSQALVVGAGGAARAAIFSLNDRGAEVFVSGRNPQRVARLARACGATPVLWRDLEDQYYDVLVQTTPVGMSPNVAGDLFPGRIPADIVFDMVYNPLETALLAHAREDGKETISGLEMFIEQAAAQFEIWTGDSAPRVAMRNAVLEVLEGA